MTGSSESGFGSGGGPPIPADPSEEEPAFPDAEFDDPNSADRDPAVGGGEFLRQSKPFRGWDAAREPRDSGPSLWARFSAWLAGLFRRTHDAADDVGADDSGATLSDEYGVAAPTPRSSFDDLDAPWGEPHPSGDIVSRRQSDELPNPEDFEPPWDDPSAGYEAADTEQPKPSPRGGAAEIDEPSVPASVSQQRDSDALWDEPRVSASAKAPTDPITPRDLDFVWSAPGVEAEVDLLAEPLAASAPKRQSFISRLFGRRKSGERKRTDERTAIVIGFGGEKKAGSVDHEGGLDESPSARQPAVADFAEAVDLAAIDGPDVGEATIDARRRASIEYSAEDAAQLADLLGEPTVPVADASFAEPPAVAPPPAAKKPGFFSSLLMRRSLMKLRVAEPAVEEFAAAADTVDESSLDPPSVPAEAEQGVADTADDTETLRWARPSAGVEAGPAEVPAPAPAPAPAPELAAPFVDARDDFRGAPAAVPTASVESRRITEPAALVAVNLPDDGEKTDEFEVVMPMRADVVDAPATAAVTGFFGRLFGSKEATTDEATADLVGGSTVQVPVVVERTDGQAPFVLAKFRMFYNEVIRDKHQKSDVISGFATAIVSAAAADMADPEFAAQLLSKRLSEMLELQAAESNWTGGDAVKYYPDAQYAMVALADETFATVEWPGRRAWHKHMLEPRMYGTRGASVEFFHRVDRLLVRAPDTSQGARDLARVYLLVIASGFRGMFREPALTRPLAEYRRRLYEFGHLADPLGLYASDRVIFPEAASRTRTSRAVGRFTGAQKWIAAVVVLATVYATVSHVAWRRLSADLKDVMSRIETSKTSGGGRP